MEKITKNEIIEFGEHLKLNYIPIENNYVPNHFISFVLNCNDDIFFDFFDILSSEEKKRESYETIQEIRKDISRSLLNEISTINHDFYYRSFSDNSFIDLEEIIYSIGFTKFDTYHFSLDENIKKNDVFDFIEKIENKPMNIHFKDNDDSVLASMKDRMIYYYHKEFGLLWEVQTYCDHYVFHSVIYGNIEKKDQKQKNLKDMTSHRLIYSNFYGFSIDMKTLPLYKFEDLITEYKFIDKWLILPEPDFTNGRFFHGLSLKYNNRFRVPSNMIDFLAENFGDDFFNIDELDVLFNMFLDDFPSVKTDFILIDILFDGYKNANYFYNYINKINNNPFWTREKIHSCVFLYFKRINQKIVGNYKDDNIIIKFLSYCDKKQLKELYKNQTNFTNTFQLSDIVLSYIELNINSNNAH